MNFSRSEFAGKRLYSTVMESVSKMQLRYQMEMEIKIVFPASTRDTRVHRMKSRWSSTSKI